MNKHENFYIIDNTFNCSIYGFSTEYGVSDRERQDS